jgi:hypothetical protein
MAPWDEITLTRANTIVMLRRGSHETVEPTSQVCFSYVGQRRIYPCRLSEEDTKHLQGAERVEGSLEVREPLGSTSDW